MYYWKLNILQTFYEQMLEAVIFEEKPFIRKSCYVDYCWNIDIMYLK